MKSLITFRLSLNLTQKEMGEALGVNAVTYGQWERGKRYPSLNTLHRISKTFGCVVTVMGDRVEFMKQVKE